jgi:hypothetical protein
LGVACLPAFAWIELEEAHVKNLMLVLGGEYSDFDFFFFLFHSIRHLNFLLGENGGSSPVLIELLVLK